MISIISLAGSVKLERTAALEFVNDPGTWLDALTTQSLPEETRRDFLVRRAYLNPAGRIYDNEIGNENGWLYFQRFRPFFVQAGFEVVDCPSLTYGHKNAADIRMTIDILKSLAAATIYDEFLIASSDADFTPLLQILRANDRRTTIISTGETAIAYRSIAHIYLGATDIIDMLTDTSSSEKSQLEVRHKAKQYITESDGTILLSELGAKLRSKFGKEIDQTDWFGAGSLGNFVRSLDYRTAGHYALDPDKHPEPNGDSMLKEGEVTPAPNLKQEESDFIPEYIARIFRITGQPQLSSKKWKAIFEGLALYASTHEFVLTECTAWTRDYVANTGCRVGRNVISSIVLGVITAGLDLKSRPAPIAIEISDVIFKNIISRAQDIM